MEQGEVRPAPLTMKLLSRFHFGIQWMFLPALVEEMGPLFDKEKRFVAVCELVRLESFLAGTGWCGNGRKPDSRINMAKGFLSNSLYNMPTTRALN